MDWLTANGFWVVIFIAFVGMHLFCHGGHHRHGGTDHPLAKGEEGSAEGQARVNEPRTVGHQQ